jgi:hypothetical protein
MIHTTFTPREIIEGAIDEIENNGWLRFGTVPDGI